MTIAERVAATRARIEAAARRAGRDPADVTLVAVSKTFAAPALLDALAAGVSEFGENRAQELKEKAAVIGRERGLVWHFVGHLQTNKVRQVVGLVSLIHSVDRIGLGEVVARRARSLGISQDVLVEVNVSGEATKTGIEPARAPALAAELAELDGLRVRGVMTIPPYADDAEESRPFFKQLADLGADVAARVPGATHLSMGMTSDYEVAIEEGASIVRVGEAIFGPRRARGE